LASSRERRRATPQPATTAHEHAKPLAPGSPGTLLSPPRCQRRFADPSPRSLRTRPQLVVRRDFRIMHRGDRGLSWPSPLQGVGPHVVPKSSRPCFGEHLPKIPIARAVARGFVQPGFDEIAPSRRSPRPRRRDLTETSLLSRMKSGRRWLPPPIR